MPSSARCRRLPTAHPAQHTPRSVGTHNARKPPPTSDSPAPLNNRTAVLDFTTWPARVDSAKAGLLLLIPDLVALDLPALVKAAGYPGTRVVPATSWLLSLLALKLTRTRRVSHVDDLLLTDPAAALLAGLATLPKKTALTDYSYRTGHDHHHAFLAALDRKMIAGGLATGDQAIFDLDFHAVMHWGNDPALEKHYVPTRSQRARPVLTFFARLRHPQPGLRQRRPGQGHPEPRGHRLLRPLAQASGQDPHLLVMDQKVTTQPVLAELDQRGIRFLTLRMRSPALIRDINSLHPADYKTITLDRSGPHNRPRVHESTIRPSNYPGNLRQFIITGLGRDTPTVIITNDTESTAKQLITRYARRMTIEQRLAESSAPSTPTRCPPRSTSTSTSTSCSACSPKPCSPPCAPAYPATPVLPPTSCNAASWKPPARSSPPQTRSPCASTGAPTPRPAPSRSARHPGTLVGQPHPPLRIHLILGANQLRGNPR